MPIPIVSFDWGSPCSEVGEAGFLFPLCLSFCLLFSFPEAPSLWFGLAAELSKGEIQQVWADSPPKFLLHRHQCWLHFEML